jgi:DNA polymerase-1
MTFLALDTDILLYRSTSSAEKEVDWGDDVWSLWCDLKDAKDAFREQVENIGKKLGVSNVVCALSDSGSNYRKTVDPTYKSNRKGTRKPVGYSAMKEWVGTEYNTIMKPGLEGDDCLGLLATRPGNDCIMVSDDKDLKTIPGHLYRPQADEMLTITEDEADRFFLTQVLTGDTTDGYKGVPGIGPKKAEVILGSRPHWGAVEQAYIKAGLTKADALTQARLARILRWSDWDTEKGEVILWKP